MRYNKYIQEKDNKTHIMFITQNKYIGETKHKNNSITIDNNNIDIYIHMSEIN